MHNGIFYFDMLVEKILGNWETKSFPVSETDYVSIEWYEARKRVLRKKSRNGRDIAIKRQDNSPMRDKDILWRDDSSVIILEILPCEAIVLTPANMYEMATLCYEVGNRHSPLFLQGDEVLLPYDAPMYRMLEANGFNPIKSIRQLKNMLYTSVKQHAHYESEQTSIFSKILKLTQKSQ